MRRMKIVPLLLTAALLLSACTAPSPTTVPPETEAVPETTSVPTDTPEPSPTPVPPRELTICLSEEPSTLYLYGSGSRAMWNVLEGLYDGPIDITSAGAVPVIVEEIPSLENGKAAVTAVDVRLGDPIIDADGRYVALNGGTRVYPAGCRTTQCITAWDGFSALQMDQLSATYTLKEGITWSDGQPVRAQDSVFSYRVASDPATPASHLLTDRTRSYEAVDDRQVRWTGIPGYTEARFAATFWSPLPEHQLGTVAAGDLLSNETAAKAPLGWGAFVLKEWKAGEYIRLERNPNYFRAAEGLPHLDGLVFRFTGHPADSALEELVAGNCDVVDRNDGFVGDLEELINTEHNGRLKMLLEQGPEWEMLAFGVVPAAYDDGFQPGTDRTNFFADGRVRQALAMCIDRVGMAAEFFQNRGLAVNSLLPPGSPLAQEGSAIPAFDPAAGAALLEAAGWVDDDADPATPRIARGAEGASGGTPLRLTLLTTAAPLRQRTAARLSEQLAACGVGVETQTLDSGQFFAPGPDGPVFGRKFDLALFSYAHGSAPSCRLFTGAQVPRAENYWTGANVTGMNEAGYNTACANFSASPGSAELGAAADQAFGGLLPALPLFYHLQVAITAPDVCGLTLDPAARDLLVGVETLDTGETCP